MIAVYTEFRPNRNLLEIAALSLLEVDVPRREPVDGFRPPSRLTCAWFWLRRTLLQVRRLASDFIDRPKLLKAWRSDLPGVVEKRSPLYREQDPAEVRLELGKVQNLRLVARRLNGIEVPAGETFSFWRHVGRCTRSRGFVRGRQLQEGCLIPAIGGGICQLTNALYSAALDAGLDIVERHPHTRSVPGTQAGRDATVAWNYIDLRIKSDRPFRIEARLTADELVVRLCTPSSSTGVPPVSPMGVSPMDWAAKPPRPEESSAVGSGQRHELRVVGDQKEARSCATCGLEDCHHWNEVERTAPAGDVAFLVDQWFPEFAQYLAKSETNRAIVFRPLDGERWRRPRYDWPASQFLQVRNFTFLTLRRAYRQRRLAEPGAARQIALLEGAEELARAYAAKLPFHVRHLVVSQNLLPFLWREGVLGGRTFDVLMTRLPMGEIQRRLDIAAERHPERRLLTDFRAPAEMIEAEAEALQRAALHVTSHADVARHVARPMKLGWPDQAPLKWTPGPAIVFPGPTAARKGAYEVRDIARRLDLEVMLLGSELEGADFWAGVKTRRAGRGDDLAGVCAVVQPALIEERPIYLLKALAAGCPVIATPACGLDPQPGLALIAADDVEALFGAVKEEGISPSAI